MAPTPNGDNAVVSSPTYTAGFEFRVPIRDGRTAAPASARKSNRKFDRQSSDNRWRAGKLSASPDGVRIARAASQQVDLAHKGSLAEEDPVRRARDTMRVRPEGSNCRSRRRGMLRSRHDYILAVYQHETARIALAEATGDIVGMSGERTKDGRRNHRGKSFSMVSHLLIALAAGAAVGSRKSPGKTGRAADHVSAAATGSAPVGVGCTGRVEPGDGMIVVAAAPSLGRTSGDRKVLVKEGQMVASGQVIAMLQSLADLESAVKQADARVAVAESRIAQLEAGARRR